MNVAIACGGTGGHLFPGLAIAEQLAAEGHQVLILVSKKDIDQHALDFGDKFEVVRIPVIGLPQRKLSFAMFGFLFKLLASIVICQWRYMRRKTDVVLGMGGFTSAAAVLAAQWHVLPTGIHESNSIPGKANHWAGRRAKFVACGFEECVAKVPAGKGAWTGTPVRRSLIEMPKESCREQLSLSADKPTVLIMGGSQGAHAINQAAMEAWPRIKQFNVIHLTGQADYQLVKDVYEGTGAAVCVRPFLREMELAYNAADIVVSRAGAASLTEIAHYRLPSVLIPYPYAAENHQERNAEIFEQAGAAQILAQGKLDGEHLAQAIRTLWSNEHRRKKMSDKLATLTKPKAVAEVISLLKQAAKLEPLGQPTEAAA